MGFSSAKTDCVSASVYIEPRIQTLRLVLGWVTKGGRFAGLAGISVGGPIHPVSPSRCLLPQGVASRDERSAVDTAICALSP